MTSLSLSRLHIEIPAMAASAIVRPTIINTWKERILLKYCISKQQSHKNAFKLLFCKNALGGAFVALRPLRTLRCVRCVGWKSRKNPKCDSITLKPTSDDR